MPEVLDKETGKPLKLSGNEAAQAFVSGNAVFGKGQRVHIIDSSGQMQNIDASEVQKALEGGYRLADDLEVEKQLLQQEHGEGLETLKATGEGAARGLTFGLSDKVLTETGLVEAEDLKARQEANPIASTVAEVTGAVAPLLVSGGTSGAATGASLTARAGQAARVAGAIPRATATAGRATEAAVQGLLGSRANTLLGKAASLGAGGAVEGAIVGAGQAVSHAALDDVDLTAEQLIAGAKEGAFLGGATGAALGATVKVAQSAGQGIQGFFSKTNIDKHLENLQGTSSFRALKGPGAGKGLVEEAEALGGYGEVGNRLFKMDLVHHDRTESAKRIAAKVDELGRDFSESAKRIAPEAVDAANDEATFKAIMGKTGGKKWHQKADRFFGGAKEVGSRLRKLGVVNRSSTLETIQFEAQRLTDDLGEQIGDIMKRLDGVGIGNSRLLPSPTNAELHDDILDNVLAPMTKSGSAELKRAADRIRKELESRGLMRKLITEKRLVSDPLKVGGSKPRTQVVNRLEDPTQFGFQDLHQARGALQREMGKFDSSTKAAVTDAYRSASRKIEAHLEKAVESGAKQIDDEIAAVYKELKKDYSAVALARDASEDALQSAAARADTDIAAGVQKAFKDADDSIEKHFDELVAKAAPEDAERLLELKKNYQAAKLGRELTADALSREGANRNLSLSDMQVGQAFGMGDALHGGIDPGTIAIGYLSGYGHKLIREKGAAVLAHTVAGIRAAKEVTKQALDVEKATDSAVRAFFTKAKETVKRGTPIGAAQQAETRQERYDRSVGELSKQNTDSIVARVSARMSESSDSSLTGAYTNTVARGIEFLRSKAPKARPSDMLRPDLDKRQRVSDSEQSKFLRYVEAVKDPMSVIGGMEAGNITREGVEALAAVYPRMYDTLVSRVTDMVTRMDEPLPYEKLRQLSLVLRQPLHPSMTGQFIAFAQSRYGQQAPRQGQASGAALLSPSQRKAPDLAGHMMTNSQALEAG